MFDTETTGRLLYLVLLGAAVVFWVFSANRGQGGRLLRQSAVWGLIFVATIAGFGLWQDIRDETAPRQAVLADGGQVSVPRHPDGHFYLTLDIEGTPVRFVVDTGATDMVLTREDAIRVGIDPDRLVYQGRARTANGEVRTARVRLDRVALGPVVDSRVPAWVNEGRMDTSLLGMSYLQRFERLEIAGDRLVLSR